MSEALATAARHSCESPEWYTPAAFVEAAREVMGAIDLDPASCAEANATVRAAHYFTAEDDGLAQPWHGRVFLNPPGGLVVAFWNQLLESYHHGDIEQAIWIGYSLEQLQTLQGVLVYGGHPLAFPICVPRRRIAFAENEARRAARVAKLEAAGKKANRGSSPSHANYITYLGLNTGRFLETFRKFGAVRL